MTTAHVEPTLQDLPDGPGPLTEANDGQIMRWDASQGRMVMIAIPRPVVLSSGGGGGSGGGSQAPHNHDALYAPISHNHDGVYALVGHTHEGGDDHDHNGTYAPANHNHDDRYVMLADYTAADVLAKLLTVDGTGSGLDADTLDGLNSDAFAEAGHTHDTSHDHDADYAPLVHEHAGEDITSGTVADARIASTITRDSEVFGIVLAADGAGSGLDADLLDGLNSTAFALAGHNHAHNDLTGLTDDDPHTQYVLLAGRSPQQTILGTVRIGSGTDTVATSGAILEVQQPATGGIAVRRSDTDVEFALLAASGSGLIGMATNHELRFYVNNNLAGNMLISTAGNVGIGVASPQGRLHGHDGTGGFGHFTKTGIVGSAQTIIPDGTGDVLHRIMYMVVIRTTDGAVDSFVTNSVVPGANHDFTLDGGTNTLRFAVSAGGAFTVQRTAGTKTYEISLWCVWR